MIAAILRVLALFALMLMPVGMGLAPAEAAAPGAHAGMSMPADGHCDDREENGNSKAPVRMHCASACTALPAEPVQLPPAAYLPRPPQVAALIHRFAGTAPPPATPPPRLS